MELPNYKKSLVNLMSSLMKGMGGKPLYKPLKALDPKIVNSYQNVVLIVIDGLGYEFLEKYGKDSFLIKYVKERITSVFPSTTASAITTIVTGVAPQQHAITGWYANLKEVGGVVNPLLFETRLGHSLASKGVQPKDIFTEKAFDEKIKRKSYLITHHDIVNSEYNKIHNNKSERYNYENDKQSFDILNRTLSVKGKKFIQIYYPELDHQCHNYSPDSREAIYYFKSLDRLIEEFVNNLGHTQTLIIITADHGLTSTPKNKLVKLANHPKLAECLTLPLAGEPRLAYCYVRPTKTAQFEYYIKKKLSNKCRLFKAEQLIKKGCYGLYKPNPKLYERIGDYILAMNDHYTIRDTLLGHKDRHLAGNHGGVSKEEMYVPLIIIKTK